MIKGKIKFAWKMASLMPGYVLGEIDQVFKRLPDHNKKIVFFFNESRLFRDDDNSGREAFQIMKTFSDGGGYNVYFYKPRSFLNYYRLRKYGRLIYQIKNLKFIDKLPSNSKDFIYAFDSIDAEAITRSWKRLLYVNIEKSPAFQIGNVIPVPFCMHPYIYTSKADQHIFKYRESERKLRVFFGGNLNKDYYNDSIFKERYPHHLSRLEAVDVLLSSGLNVSLVTKTKDLQWFLNSPKLLNQMIIFQTDHTFPIKPRYWLKILSQSDFFMCFSGTSYPMCHNVIEAMSVGSIPIIAYQDWFNPPLEHGKNAIVYTDQTDLISKLNEIFSMNPKEIQKLRRGVVNYYDTYLTEEYLVRKYEQEAQNISTIIRFPRFVLSEKEDREGENFNQDLKSRLPSLFSSMVPVAQS